MPLSLREAAQCVRTGKSTPLPAMALSAGSSRSDANPKAGSGEADRGVLGEGFAASRVAHLKKMVVL